MMLTSLCLHRGGSQSSTGESLEKRTRINVTQFTDSGNTADMGEAECGECIFNMTKI